MGLMYVGTIWSPAKYKNWDGIYLLSPPWGVNHSIHFMQCFYRVLTTTQSSHWRISTIICSCDVTERNRLGRMSGREVEQGDKKVVGQDKIHKREWNAKYLVVSVDFLLVYINQKVVITILGSGEWSKYMICVGECSFSRITREWNISRHAHGGFTMRFIAWWLCVEWHQVGGLVWCPNRLPEREGHGNSLGSHRHCNQWWYLGAWNCLELTLNPIKGIGKFLAGLDSEEWEWPTWTCWHVAQNLGDQLYPHRSPPNPTGPTMQKQPQCFSFIIGGSY